MGVVKYCAGDRRPDDTSAVPPMVERCFKERGWVQWDEVNDDPREWSLQWKSGRFKTNEYAHARPDVRHQRINHYPKTSPICVKDQLVRLIRRLRATYGSAFDYLPQSYLLPNEYLKFVKTCMEQPEKTMWICKPAVGSAAVVNAAECLPMRTPADITTAVAVAAAACINILCF